MTHPQGGQPGHPEPAPVPSPDPDPPMPIPPFPTPEPPHLAAGRVDDFIDAPPEAAPVEWPPPGAFPDESPTADMPAIDLGDTGYYPGATGQEESTQVIPADEWQPPSAWPSPSPPSSAPGSGWHAQHEAPGEWQTEPPEHLGWQNAPSVELPTVAAQTPAAGDPIWAADPRPAWETPLQKSVPRRRGALWVSLALVATVLLCGGGALSAYFLLRDADNPGSPDPATAVDRFLTAVYTEQDASAAEGLVCREARDAEKIADRVQEIKTYSSGYLDPVFRWAEPSVSDDDEDRAAVAVKITMATADEKTAEQQLQFTVIHKTGWLVCDVMS